MLYSRGKFLAWQVALCSSSCPSSASSNAIHSLYTPCCTLLYRAILYRTVYSIQYMLRGGPQGARPRPPPPPHRRLEPRLFSPQNYTLSQKHMLTAVLPAICCTVTASSSTGVLTPPMLASSFAFKTCSTLSKSTAAVLYNTYIPHCTPYCTVLYCTVLYCTVLYCTVLYCTVLCYALCTCHEAPPGSRPSPPALSSPPACTVQYSTAPCATTSSNNTAL